MHDSHRLFLQTFMSQGMLGSEDVNNAFQEACTRFGGNNDQGGSLSQSIQLLMSWLHVKSNYFKIISAFVDICLKKFYFSTWKLV